VDGAPASAPKATNRQLSQAMTPAAAVHAAAPLLQRLDRVSRGLRRLRPLGAHATMRLSLLGIKQRLVKRLSGLSQAASDTCKVEAIGRL
jgi:hypothetical protein